VVNFTNEEGTRFAPAMVASGVFAGLHTLDWAYNRLHIEQGPILEKENIDIGVVTHGQGLTWLQVTLTGRESHTGSTPMPMRVNAGLGMARITELVHEIAIGYAPDAVGAIGHCEVFPNSRNIIPGRSVFTVDFRHPDKEIIAKMETELRAGATKIADDIGLTMEIEQVGGFDPVKFNDNCVTAVRNAAERLGYSHLSHNEAEEITPEWAGAGANVLFHAVVETAEITE